ncbi:sensor histidine kinase [Cryptosporangium aurantiacum]|uniref:sensor histidine kinase n=1 Tax=Cryptosporangium aurantiacum TaxID=134849 RepID=UPI0009FD4248|nr:sensor histidine kinase [Cryptosporangium aurantiacum]
MRNRVRELLWLAAGAALGLPAPILIALAVAAVPASLAAGIGLGLLAGVVWASRLLAGFQRRRVGIPVPYRPLPAGPILRLRAVLVDPATRRDLAWLVCQFVAGTGSFVVALVLWLTALQCLTAPILRAALPERAGYDPVILELVGGSGPTTWLLVPVGVALVVVATRVPRYLIRGQTWLAGALLGPTAAADLAAKVDRLTTDRAATVDASAAELRRIERDLHDGAQARLVAMAMNLGVAEDLIDDDPAVAKVMLSEARAGAGAALTELRDLVRGIHPPILADRGLAEAVRALVLGSAVPVDLDLRLERRLAAPVESAAYFAIAETVTNAIRHGAASHVLVTLIDAGEALRISVYDDGCGGADPTAGTGLLGIRRRLSAFDGSLSVHSPLGGPTEIEMELPCVS